MGSTSAQGTNNPAEQVHIVEPEKLRFRRLRLLLHWLLKRIWYIHPGALLTIRVSPSDCYQILSTASRPSTQRLHLRNLFARGRRYFMMPLPDAGFRMTTTHKLPWRLRRRTRPSATLYAEFESLENTALVHMKLRGRIRALYFIDTFLWPTFMASMLIFMPWQLWTIALLIVLLYSLSWAGHRYNAALEVHEMVFFIETVLEEFMPEPPPELTEKKPEVVYENEREFAEIWEQFYEEVKEE